MSRAHSAICISICDRDWQSFDRALTAASGQNCWIELRLDCLGPELLKDIAPLRRILAACPQPTIVTLRAADEGGKGQLSEEQRLDFWINEGLQLPSSYVDLELSIVEGLLRAGVDVDWSRVICSHHDLQVGSANPDQVFDKLSKTPARILKIAVQAEDAIDGLKAFRLLERAQSSHREMIAIAMGPAGVVTRVLGPSRGSFLTYASSSLETATASGQLTVEELTKTYRLKRITKDSLITGVVGHPVAHSISPQIHNASFEYLGIDAVYVPFEVCEVSSFLQRMVHPRTREIDWPLRGLSITAPHKSETLRQLDWVDPVSEQIDAVNTVVVEKNRLCGYNTDAEGFLLPLKGRVSSLTDLRVAIIGAGGVARAAICGLVKEQAKVEVFARDPQKTQKLAERWPVECRNLNNANFQDFDVVVNATPLGTKGSLEGKTPVIADQLRGARLAYDLVYNPLDTKFLREAHAAGCETLSGLEMFLGQAVRQFELWMRQSPNLAVMRAAAMQVLGN